MTDCTTAYEHKGHLYFQVEGVDLTHTEWAIYRAVLYAGHEGVLCRDLTEQMYGGREDGGPLYANTVMYLAKMKLNAKLRTKGKAIVATKRGAGARYRLVGL